MKTTRGFDKSLAAMQAQKRKLRSPSQLFHLWRTLSSPIRLLPDFVVVGAQRCGSSSLYLALTRHPDVYSALLKEIDYFNNDFKKGVFWYRYHFPTIIHKHFVMKIEKRSFTTGEASIDYMFHPYAISRLSQVVPNAKLIAILRNPVHRAYSSYWHSVRLGLEHLSFEGALNNEENRLDCGRTERKQDEYYFCPNHLCFSYLSRGIYVHQIKELMAHFSRSQILIIRSEEFFEKPYSVLRQVFEFLNVSECKVKVSGKHNAYRYENMAPALRKRLYDYFEPYNKELYNLIGRHFGWEDQA